MEGNSGTMHDHEEVQAITWLTFPRAKKKNINNI